MNNPLLRAADSGPWYREPWPWALMSGPFIVIVAGLFTAYLAVVSNDGLVTEDYYKRGLAANQTVSQSDVAIKLGLTARIYVDSQQMKVDLSARESSFLLPGKLVVTVSHPTRAGLDQSRTMALIDGSYSAAYQLPAAGHWLVLVSDEAQTWRLMGNVVLPSAGATVIGYSGQNERQQKE
ncbi:MAG: FixH family protein [Rhodocyclaceae bacterium]|nr:FixH family protein [Rhodocyclaceae bacterium]